MNRLAAMNRAAHVAERMSLVDLRKLDIDIEKATLGLQLAVLLDTAQLQQSVSYAFRMGEDVTVIPFGVGKGGPWNDNSPLRGA